MPLWGVVAYEKPFAHGCTRVQFQILLVGKDHISVKYCSESYCSSF